MIAACEWIFAGRPLEDVLALLGAAGYDGIEVNGEPARDAAALCDALESAGLRATGTTAICNWPTDERDLAHPDREARRRAVAYCHLVNRVEQALELAAATGVDDVGVIADAFHMQLEETDSAPAVARAGARLAALHVADSNRLGLGHGQLDLAPVLDVAARIGFDGPLVLECTAPGPNPFDADKGPRAMRLLDRYVHESAEILKGALEWR